MTSTYVEEPEIREAEPMLERTASSATSGADGRAVSKAKVQLSPVILSKIMAYSLNLPFDSKEELTAEELEHIERVRRLAEGLEMTSTCVEEPEIREAEPEFREAEPEFQRSRIPMLERTASSATSGADEEAVSKAKVQLSPRPHLYTTSSFDSKEELTAEELEHIERVRRLAEGLEMTSTYVEEPEIESRTRVQRSRTRVQRSRTNARTN
ncbi:unnamed protein product, partial [Bursaphelenchus okinawaensis]